MSQSSTPIATVALYGRQTPVFCAGDGVRFSYRSGKIIVGKKLATNLSQLTTAYEQYCRQALKKIIDRQIQKLRTKKIKVKIDYLQNKQKIQREELLSVNDYLDKFGYSREIEIEIGTADKEWGINSIDPKKKKFKLFFNQNLIKYDSGKHIEYVVAHELTHIFHRHHETEFHKTLARLYTRKTDSENFFSNRIRYIFRPDHSLNTTLMIIFGVAILVLFAFLLRVLWAIGESWAVPQTRF